jgi:hypothetical protein
MKKMRNSAIGFVWQQRDERQQMAQLKAAVTQRSHTHLCLRDRRQ